jgi:hypothetical protein
MSHFHAVQPLKNKKDIIVSSLIALCELIIGRKRILFQNRLNKRNRREKKRLLVNFKVEPIDQKMTPQTKILNSESYQMVRRQRLF